MATTTQHDKPAKGPLPSMTSPITAPGTPEHYRARVRMYRHGLGDCFLLSIPQYDGRTFEILIDCGALARDKAFMQKVVAHIRDTVRAGTEGKARLNVVVGTHEHKDHLSGFNQARDLFNTDFDIEAVWLAWTENLGEEEIRAIKETRKRVARRLAELAATPRLAADLETFEGLSMLAGFGADDDSTGERTVADALAYLKTRGKAGELRYLEPGEAFPLGTSGVRVHVLGPPRDARTLKSSEVTQQMKHDEVVYHLDGSREIALDALSLALDAESGKSDRPGDPFSAEHRMRRDGQGARGLSKELRGLLDECYDAPEQAWRRIDRDWLGVFEQLALDLDNDTNNTSLVLAFEFGEGGEVLLFVADAQIGSWLSWNAIEFKRGESGSKVSGSDLLRRTVFYKVGHHCSHNATAKSQGLELMTRDDLVAFIPLDQHTASNQGTKGWEMPAPPLYRALKRRTGSRVVLSDVTEPLPEAARAAGVIATEDYIDFFLV